MTCSQAYDKLFQVPAARKGTSALLPWLCEQLCLQPRRVSADCWVSGRNDEFSENRCELLLRESFLWTTHVRVFKRVPYGEDRCALELTQKGQQLQGLSVCPFGPNIPGMVSYLGTAASVLTPERCLPSVNWVQVL